MSNVLDRPKEGVAIPLMQDINLAPITAKWRVLAFNNDVTTFHDVLKVFVQVCLYDARAAKYYTQQIHTEGKSVCYWGTKEECEFVIAAFKNILVKCELLEN